MKCHVEIVFESSDNSPGAIMLGYRSTQLRDRIDSEVTESSELEMEQVIKEVTAKIRNGWKFAQTRVKLLGK